MIIVVLSMLAFLALIAIMLLTIEDPPKRSDESSSQDKTLTSSEKRLQDARAELSGFEFDTFRMTEMHHGDHHLRMSLRREHQDLVDRVRDAEKEVYGEPITSEAPDWRDEL